MNQEQLPKQGLWCFWNEYRRRHTPNTTTEILTGVI